MGGQGDVRTVAVSLRSECGIAAGVATILVSGCAARPDFHLADPAPEQASREWERVRPTRPWSTLEGIRDGRHLYVERCGSCHALFDPAGRGMEAWRLVLDRMAPKAGLDSLQVRKITDWLATRANPTSL
jgi:hypothetical protein